MYVIVILFSGNKTGFIFSEKAFLGLNYIFLRKEQR